MASVKKRDNGAWRVRWRDHDGRSREANFARKADADRHAAFVTADMARGTYIDAAAGRSTVQEVGEAWRAAQPHRAGSAALIERQLRLHVYPTLGERQVGQVRRSDVQALATRLSQTLAPATVAGVIKTLSAIFNSAVLDGLVAARASWSSPAESGTRTPPRRSGPTRTCSATARRRRGGLSMRLLAAG